MSKEDNIFAGFEQISDYMTKPLGSGGDGSGEKSDPIHTKSDNSGAVEISPEELEALGKASTKVKEEEAEEIEQEETEETDEEVDEVEETEEDEIEEVDEEEVEDDTVEVEETDEEESDTSEIEDFVDLFAGELGWELDDKNKPKSVEELIGFMSNIIEENSIPQYANEESQKIDTFLRNGGNLKDYFETAVQGVDVDTADLSDDNVQKEVIREHLKALNYSDEKINRRLERFEESGILEEEAEESAEFLKGYKKEKEEKLLKQQESQKREALEQQQKFISNVESTINNLDEIQGIPLNPKKKKELMDYLFKVESDGKTAYQKDYSKDVSNLIVSAFFTKEGDKAYKHVKKKAESDAVLNFKKKLKTKKKPKQQKPYSSGGADFGDTLSAISKVLTKN